MGSVSRIGRPTGADGERTRRRIMDVATTHMAAVGYVNATMKAIAEEAGLTSGAIYHYFRSKDELALTIVNSVVDEVMRRLDEATRIEGSLQQRFVALLEEALVIVADHPAATRFVSSLYLESGRHPEFELVLEEEREAEGRLYRRLIDEAVSRGELPFDTDRQAMVDMFTSITWGLTHLSVTASVDRHRAAIRATEALLAGALFTARHQAVPGLE